MKHLWRLLAMLVLTALLATAVNVHSIAIVGDGGPHSITVNSTGAIWVQLVVPSTNTQSVMVGDQNGQTFPLVAGSGQFLPPLTDARGSYDLSHINYQAALNDTLNVLYAF